MVLAAACGGGGGNDDDGGVIDNDAFPGDAFNFADADPNAPDAGANTGCVNSPDSPQCNNCLDDDGDGFFDGDDINCSSALDDDEATFSTGIPGDNKDDVHQDCFFDGDSGAGNDGCAFHTCCLFLPDPCPAEFHPSQFNPDTDCDVSPECQANCGAITPPGCDCFGCCTLCDGMDCVDINTNPNVSPDCTPDQLFNPDVCKPCTFTTDCGNPCDPAGCILCPGQTEEDLPPECTQTVCPEGQTPCDTNADCTADQFCSIGCCIKSIG
ncbi:MAG TPA: hypothetical protein VL172_10900 [Kofleriaceae bacterium]|nr:hypothetical protein [Kofleriaceae bacterium]